MEKAARLNLLNKLALLFSLTASLAFGACATQAPNLPEDYGSVHATDRISLADFDSEKAKLSCSDIKDELNALNTELNLQKQDIQNKRRQNQTAGYIGAVFFLPALLATDNSQEAKEKMTNIKDAKDLLFKLQTAKKCPTDML